MKADLKVKLYISIVVLVTRSHAFKRLGSATCWTKCTLILANQLCRNTQGNAKH